jgi:putative intracellular protease/amidase
MHTPSILFVVTSADRMGTAPEPTGSWLEEIAAPYYTFRDARCEVTLASPKGGAAPIDPKSNEAENQTASTRRWEADAKAAAALAATTALSSINPADYDAIFFAGGHGTMEDFPTNANVKHMVESFYAAGKPVSSVCHGPACLVAATKPNGEPLVKGHHFTCFSDAEETSIGLEKLVPFMLETRLNEQGGTSSVAAPFKAHVIVDRNLITGQNPASTIPAAEAVIYQLRAKANQRRAA